MLQISRELYDEMISHAVVDDPDECCGILSGSGNVVQRLHRMTNVEHSPYRYSMDPKELYLTYRDIDEEGEELLAIYHSHTHSPAFPSPTDVRLATWPDASYILISLMDKGQPIVKAFRIEQDEIIESGFHIGILE